MKTFRTPRLRSLVDAFLTSIFTPVPRSRAQLGAVDLGDSVERQLGRIAGDVDKFIAAQKTRFGELDTRQEQLQARLTDVEQKSVRSRGASAGTGGFGPTFGERLEAAFGEERAMFGKTRSLTLDVPHAAITTTNTGGAHGTRDVPGAPPPAATQLIALLNAGPRDGLTTLHYARRTGVTGGAAAQDSEGAAKAAAEPVFSPIAQAAITVAGYATVSEQALSAAGGLARAVDSHLSKSVRDATDAILIGGTTATAWPFAGFAALAQAFTSDAAYTSLLDAIISGATRMRLQGFNPRVAVLPEAGYLGTRLAKDSAGRYLIDTFARDLALAIDGMSLAISAAVPAGKALLIDPQFCGLLSDDSVRVTLGYVNDQFTKNMITLRAEIQVIPFFADYQGATIVTPHA